MRKTPRHPRFSGPAGAIRNLLLYPAELRGRHFFDSSNHISRSDATLEPADCTLPGVVKTSPEWIFER